MSSGYRKLCNYNGYNDCERGMLGMVNFSCSPGLGCHQTRDPVNKEKGVYSNYGECTKQCKKPVGRSYDCVKVNVLGSHESACIQRNGPHGQFHDLHDCRKQCK